mgnify:CR=1 FL=1
MSLFLSFSFSLYSSASVIEEKNLLFSENMDSMNQGNIHVSSSLMERDELLGAYPEIQDIDQNGSQKKKRRSGECLVSYEIRNSFVDHANENNSCREDLSLPFLKCCGKHETHKK